MVSLQLIVSSLSLFVSFTEAYDLQQPIIKGYESVPVVTPKIAIIGAGAGGSSFAYYLQKYTSHLYDLDIFEKSSYIGGRSTTIGNYDPNFEGVDIELGGSIFIESNKILKNAVKTFNLSETKDDLFPKELFNNTFGIWDGNAFVFKGTTNGKTGILKAFFKMFWRYGVSPYKTYALAKRWVGIFVKQLYKKQFPFADLTIVANTTGLLNLTSVTGLEFLTESKISPEFAYDFVGATTRVNYRSNVNDIHGLGSMVSTAADENPTSVEGGNYKIFESFINASNATLYLNTDVTKVTQLENGTWSVSYTSSNFTTGKIYDEVVIAAPYHQTGIEFSGVITPVKEVEYKPLWANYIRVERANPIAHPYFGAGPVPELILTKSLDDSLPFYSINKVHYDNVTDLVTYKIFSASEIDETFIKTYLYEDPTGVEIFYTKKWSPYPYLAPIDSFEQFQIGAGLWYLNGMEELISNMETSALAGANVAGLIAVGKNTTEIALEFDV